MVVVKTGDHIFFDNLLHPKDLGSRNSIYATLRWDIVRDYISLIKLVDGNHVYPKIVSLSHDVLEIHRKQRTRLESMVARAKNPEMIKRVFYSTMPNRCGFHALSYLVDVGTKFRRNPPIVLIHSYDNPIGEELMLNMADKFYNEKSQNEPAIFSGNGL